MLVHDYDEKKLITQVKLKALRAIHKEREASVVYSAKRYLLCGVGGGRVGVAKTSFHRVIKTDN
ncbi:MAG: hypothetical protein JWO55_380 [Candidatus Saccharibacteria bacterium]|jgi:ketol-acid reductoisomerase|nr:hypothetical protein [Candidatus Saccharibacteria bacterium]